jgi:RNA polymerase sigma-70 factor (ECF subfamily)
MNEPQAATDRDAVELLSRAAAGDRDAQLQLFERQKLQVHRTLYRIMGGNREMDDLAQDAFVEVFRSLVTFRGESSLETWIDTITVRVAFRHLSRRAPRPEHLSVVAGDETAADPERAVQARHAMRRLYAILDRLEPKYRIAYALHVIDGRSLREVARVTGVSLVAAKNRVWRARRMVNERARRDPYLAELIAGTEDRGGDARAARRDRATGEDV